ncbi:MAG: CIA30 family protein [Chromatiaceae bacterium]
MSPRRFPAQRLLAILGALVVSASAADTLLIDDFAVVGGPSRLGTPWRLVTDGVMGGLSAGGLSFEQIDGRRALCLRGEVRLENNGGFVQAALDLAPEGDLDASAYAGVRLLVRGNGEAYNLHLKTADLHLPWQSYRSSFPTGPEWREIRLPLGGFEPHRTTVPLDTGHLRSLGLVAIGRAFAAELCVAEISLYRDSP